MRLEDGFYYKTGLVSNDFLDLLHEIDIDPECFNCIVSHDWVYFSSEPLEPLFTYCHLKTYSQYCPLALMIKEKVR